MRTGRYAVAIVLCVAALLGAQPRGVRADAGVPQAGESLARAQTLFREGVAAYDAGRLEDALRLLDEAHRLVPGPDLAFSLGRVHERMGDADRALVLFRSALAAEGLAPSFRAQLDEHVRVCEELAQRQRDQIVAAPPSESELGAEARTFFLRGVTLFRRGRFDAALQAFMAAYQFSPQPEVIYNVARTSERLGRKQDAIDYYNEYLRAAPRAIDRAQVERHVRELRSRR